MNTRIPHTEYTLMIQTSSCLKTTVALLNERERELFSLQNTCKQKKSYPLWRICQFKDCNKVFLTDTTVHGRRKSICMRRQKHREKPLLTKVCKSCNQEFQTKKATQERCSRECVRQITKVCRGCEGEFQVSDGKVGRSRKYCKKECMKNSVTLNCPVCNKTFKRPASHAARVQVNYCSQKCNGEVRGQEWKSHAHKGRAAWSEETKKKYSESMKGSNNPSWKGGVTYRNRKGNYANQKIKYVRCPSEYQEMARKDGYVTEHRLKVAMQMGRPLTQTECVHHINHDATDNRIENLMLFKNNRDHKLYEAHGLPAPLWQP